ncbi:hypothetical protein [Microbacterium deminutum]|uniref:Uncharacterized protein n=1 Tax=Microbacterium deminutum TaxID=344164 RepID=A0ABP5CU45_9MICO
MPDASGDVTGSAGSPEFGAGTSEEQFRQALTRPLSRLKLGIDISDEDAASIAADETLCARCYDAWLASKTSNDSPGGSTERRRSNGDEQEASWRRALPMRFNAPPGWPDPSHDWVMEHIGLPMADYRRPPGAPTAYPVNWEWWIPQDPHWTEWVQGKRRFYGTLAGFLGFAFVGCVAIAVTSGWQGAWPGGAIGAMVAGFGLVGVGVEYVAFRKDPMLSFRGEYFRDAE